MRRCVDEDRVAVRRLLRDEGAADSAARPAPVFDDDRPPEPLRQRIEHDAADNVDAAAGRKRNDRPDRPGRPALLGRNKLWQRRDRECGYGGFYKSAARRHGCFPLISLT